MKQKIQITRKYEPDSGDFLFRGYKFILLNLVKEFVCCSYKFDECKRKLIQHMQDYAEISVWESTKEDELSK